MKTVAVRLSHATGVSGHEHPQFEVHRGEDLQQIGDVNGANAPAEELSLYTSCCHPTRELEASTDERSGQVRPILLRVHHEQLQRATDAAEVFFQVAQIAQEDLAALRAELPLHSARMIGLPTQEGHVLAAEELEHRPVALDRQLVNPVGGCRESAGRGGST